MGLHAAVDADVPGRVQRTSGAMDLAVPGVPAVAIRLRNDAATDATAGRKW